MLGLEIFLNDIKGQFKEWNLIYIYIYIYDTIKGEGDTAVEAEAQLYSYNSIN